MLRENLRSRRALVTTVWSGRKIYLLRTAFPSFLWFECKRHNVGGSRQPLTETWYRLQMNVWSSHRDIYLTNTNRKHGPMKIASPSSLFGDEKTWYVTSDWSVEPQSPPLIGPAITQLRRDQHLLIQESDSAFIMAVTPYQAPWNHGHGGPLWSLEPWLSTSVQSAQIQQTQYCQAHNWLWQNNLTGHHYRAHPTTFWK